MNLFYDDTENRITISRRYCLLNALGEKIHDNLWKVSRLHYSERPTKNIPWKETLRWKSVWNDGSKGLDALSYSISMRFDTIDIEISGSNKPKLIKRHTIPSFHLTSSVEFPQKGLFDSACGVWRKMIQKIVEILHKFHQNNFIHNSNFLYSRKSDDILKTSISFYYIHWMVSMKHNFIVTMSSVDDMIVQIRKQKRLLIVDLLYAFFVDITSECCNHWLLFMLSTS